MTIETPLQGGDARSRRSLGFPADSTVDVRQVDDQDRETLRALPYHAKTEDFEVPVQEGTDFASVPRVFVWFIPPAEGVPCSTEVIAASIGTPYGADGMNR
jgi:hypothetical protein